MSLSSALGSAISGLSASARAAELVSSNLANALTPGYGARRLEQSAAGQGMSGVQITAITRTVDDGLIADRRAASSARAYADPQAQFLDEIQRSIGTPDDPGSLQASLSRLDASLISARTTPENENVLNDVVHAARNLVTGLNSAADKLALQRAEADAQIAQSVGRMNALLRDIRQINIDLSALAPGHGQAPTLLDQRQQLVDQLVEHVPLRVVPREGQAIALYTPGGAILLDGSAARISFDQTPVIAPHMTLGTGLLSGLKINDIEIAPSGPNSPVRGGRLSALFTIRDDLAIDTQAYLDALARDLSERLQAPGIDPTRAPGDPGLLTDDGALVTPTNETGLANRLGLNALIDPEQGGAAWRLRDGLGAGSPGPGGNGAILGRISASLSAQQGSVSAKLGLTARSTAGHFAHVSTALAFRQQDAERVLSFATTRESELSRLELQAGVDSDDEMQRLLLIEQAYAANARMIQTIDDMMQQLLRI